jgi:hypothetical protein
MLNYQRVYILHESKVNPVDTTIKTWPSLFATALYEGEASWPSESGKRFLQNR